MPETYDVNKYAFEALRIRITKVMPAQIYDCLQELSDEQIWWRPNESSNSVGNLVLHVRGAVLHFLCHRIGGFEYQRDRPSEFAAESVISKQELTVLFNDMVKQAEQTFATLDPTQLGRPSTESAYYTTLFEDLFGIAVHLATHVGQIVYITKMLNTNSLNELWSKTHKSQGAWLG